MSKATFFLDDRLHQTLRLRAEQSRSTMTEIVNDALKAAFEEDLEDIADWKERRNEPTITFETLLAQLKEDGTI